MIEVMAVFLFGGAVCERVRIFAHFATPVRWNIGKRGTGQYRSVRNTRKYVISVGIGWGGHMS